MGNRGHNEGTITKRKDGRWEAKISLPNGKRKCFYGNTRQDVDRHMRAALHDIEKGLSLPDERQTVAMYLTSWLETIKYQIEGSTYRRYTNHVNLHLTPIIGKIQLAKLSGQHIQLCMSRLLDKGLSTTTVNIIHAMLHKALHDAFILGLVQRNVAEMVKPPRRRHLEMITLSETQSRQLLNLVVGDKYEAVYVLALSTGMREGEIFALRWQDVDLDGKSIVIRQTIKKLAKGYEIGKTKTIYSRRKIKISDNTVEALKQHKIRQKEESEQYPGIWNNQEGLVFTNNIGGRMIPDNFVKRQFKPLLKRLGLSKEIRFHDLRHTFATLLLSRGVNVKVVSEMLGHSDISITLRIYAHVIPGMHEIATEMMDNLLYGNGNS